jgi:type I restriction enzyme, S subunit
MSFNWPTVSIEDIAADIPNALATGPFGSAISSKFFTDSGVPVIRGSNLSADTGVRLKDDDIVFVSHEKAKEFGRSVAKVGDLIFTCWGTINQVGYIDGTSNWDEYIISNKQMKVTIDTTKVDPRFLYYVFSSPLKQNEILSNGIGAAVPGFNLGQLRKHTFQLPPLRIQSAIADTLELLDKKSNQNSQTNHTLEEMTQAIFKSWFVDFDPVKAKMNGEQPEGMDEATASLFPDKLVESELGLIPDGWEIKPFSDWVKITKGKNITKKTIVEGDVPVVAGGLKPAYFHNTHNVNGPAITISASGANAGFVNLYFENIWASDCSYISQSNTPLFFLQYVALRYNQKKIFDMQTGAAQPHIYPKDFERLMIVVPNDELCRKLEDVFASFFGTVANNKQQNIELEALRDTLLPKLLSGEIELGHSLE